MDMTTCTDGASAHTGRHCKCWQPFIFDPAQTAATKCLCPLPVGIRRQLTEAYTRQLAFDARLATGALSAALATRARGLPPAEVSRPRARFCHWARARRRCKLPCHHVYACKLPCHHVYAVDCALHTCTFRLRATRCVLQLSIAYWQHQAADCAPSTFVCALLTAYRALQTCGYIG